MLRKLPTVVVLLALQWPYLAGGFDSHESQIAGATVNWDRVRLAFRSYDQRPTDANAEAILAAIPEPGAVAQSGDRELAVMAIFDCISFYRAVVGGNSRLAEAAFRLLGYVRGGALDEELRIMLSQFLVKDPTTFLRLVKRYDFLFAAAGDYPVDMTEILDIFPDLTTEDDSRRSEEERIRIYAQRIRALESVNEPEFARVRDACLRVIQNVIAGIEARLALASSPRSCPMPELEKEIAGAYEIWKSSPDEERKTDDVLRALTKAIPRYNCRRKFDKDPVPAWWLASYENIDHWIGFLATVLDSHYSPALRPFFEIYHTSDGYIAEGMTWQIIKMLRSDPIFVLQNWLILRDYRDSIFGTSRFLDEGEIGQLEEMYHGISATEPRLSSACAELIEGLKTR